jgi:simple sugar transport system ATP-binding protein
MSARSTHNGGGASDAPVLEARGIVKSYGHVQALRGADFDVRAREVVALVGDNGAGKSTLVKILSGAQTPDGGELLFRGRPVQIGSAIAARELGIETVYQDLALAPDLDPVANLFLGREKLRGGLLGRMGFLDSGTMRAEAERTFAGLGVALQSATVPVTTLSGGQRQGVAVSRAVNWADQVVFMDEPTAALGVTQTKNVLELVERVRDNGLGVVLISHNMPEVFQVADRIQVLRLGRRVGTFRRGEATQQDVVAAMTGALDFESAEENGA